MTTLTPIRSKNYEGVICVLADDTGAIFEDQRITSDSFIRYKVEGGTAPHKPGSTGRVWTDKGEYYPSVIKCKWVPEHELTECQMDDTLRVRLDKYRSFIFDLLRSVDQLVRLEMLFRQDLDYYYVGEDMPEVRTAVDKKDLLVREYMHKIEMNIRLMGTLQQEANFVRMLMRHITGKGDIQEIIESLPQPHYNGLVVEFIKTKY